MGSPASHRAQSVADRTVLGATSMRNVLPKTSRTMAASRPATPTATATIAPSNHRLDTVCRSTVSADVDVLRYSAATKASTGPNRVIARR